MRNFFILLCMFSIHSSYAAFSKNEGISQIKISGYIPDSILKNAKVKPEIYFYNSFNSQLSNKAEIFPVTIRNNRFSVTINTKNEIGYFILKYIRIRGIYQNIFLVQSGDSVCINMESLEKINFTGIGADKMNYQHWIGKQWPKHFKSFQSINDTDRIYYNVKKATLLSSEFIDSLNIIKNSMTGKTFNLLKINIVSAIKNQCLDDMTQFIESNNAVYLEALKDELKRSYFEQSVFALTDAFVIQHSFLYQSYLFNLINFYSTLKNDLTKPTFKFAYKFINEDFLGLLRDKLITNSFLYMIRDPDAINYLKEAVLLAKDSESRNILEQMASARMPGFKAFDFSLENINGELINLQDFRGKVIIMDTWFNGCLNCIVITKQLSPVVTHFKGNKDVVFLGVNVDGDKKRFIDGVKSKKYTSEKTVNVYTNGLGQNHPMLQHYQYSGYPNLLLIDKKGFIISVNPPRPINEDTTKKLIELVKSHL